MPDSSRSTAAPHVPTAVMLAAAQRADCLDGAWEFCAASGLESLEGPSLEGLPWQPIAVPGAVAAGTDERASFLFRTRFDVPDWKNGASRVLAFDGLATLAEVWLNGSRLVLARNMLRRHVADTQGLLRAHNELVLRFAPLQSELERKLPRGRWHPRSLAHRNLRYVRSTLLGWTRGGTQRPFVGPWRSVRLLERSRVALERFALVPRLEGEDGVLRLALAGRVLDGRAPIRIEVGVAGSTHARPVERRGDGFALEAEIRVPDAIPWFTHETGTPHRYPVALALVFDDGGRLDLGMLGIGFRRIERAGDAAGFALRLNGRELFCRGACWTPTDAAALRDDPAEIRRVLRLVRDAGMNMLRVSGTMAYESDAFYEACDELGILVWQDFMFWRMDYPESDAEFAAEVREETEQLLARLHRHACVAVYCGNSEVEQQAAMYGLEPYAGRTPLFDAALREAVERWAPGVPYVSSSPTGGALPFHADAGVAHYFGLGAYLRPLSDVRESGVRFASECLAFANVPEEEGAQEAWGSEAAAATSAALKAGAPRDFGAGWDFLDVTEHYLEQLFGVGARELRRSDPLRYLALARVTPGELMARALGLWRAGSQCRGALVWWLRDLEPGAGWGVLDSTGRPKAAYWFLKRACAPRAAWFTDEGLNGLRLHAANDALHALEGRIRVRLVRSDGVAVSAAERPVRIGPHCVESWPVEALLGRFADSSWAYRFGPAPYAIALGELEDAQGGLLSSAWHLPCGLAHELRDDVGLDVRASETAPGEARLHISVREPALFVRISAAGWMPAENYFHLVPGVAREVVLRGGGRRPALRVSALNARAGADVPAA